MIAGARHINPYKFPTDDGLPWGHIENGTWHPLPKTPLLLAELGPPPFEVKLSDGRTRHVVHRPKESQ